MASVDVSSQRASLLDDATTLAHLTPDILHIIRDPASTNLLDAIAHAALQPQLTCRLFAHFEDVFADICARWILKETNATAAEEVLACFARILRFAPHLSALLDHFLSRSSPKASNGTHPHQPSPPSSVPVPAYLDLDKLRRLQPSNLQTLLLGVWRLISLDAGHYSGLISPSVVQSLFKHPDYSIRYLAIRIFCLQLHAADAKLEALISEHIGVSTVIAGDFDGTEVDFGFLSLHENGRVERLAALRREIQGRTSPDTLESAAPQILTPMVARYGRTILPRPSIPGTQATSSLVPTPTTTTNLESLASLLKDQKPILLHGLPGSGKTSLIHEFAKDFGKHSEMVTLHINEQTDAKMLIGLYSTDSKPGSFQWRAGVLTTAVKEGRWVLIEDLDRAPNEVMSTLLPLIERGQLLIPSRDETIEASSDFRLFATVRTSRGMHGRETLPNLLGLRFWQHLSIQAPTEAEFSDIIVGTYPILRKYVREILSVYRRLTGAGSSGSKSTLSRALMDRQPTSRDLLRWCRRLATLLTDAGCVTGQESISETTRDQMFMEAVDCFVSRIPDVKLRKQVIFQIAEEWHMSKERVEHYLEAHIPQLEDNADFFRIGRTRLRKKKDRSGKIVKSKRPFANTTHAKKLLEQAAVAVKAGEPVLLVGETGIGKTTVIQQLADTLGHKLVAVNLSQQSEVGDLLGGFKPVNVRSLAVPLKEEFEDLFAATGISATKNQPYLERLGKTFARGDWVKVARQWREAPKMFAKILEELTRREREKEARDEDAQPTKRRKTESKLQKLIDLKPRWDAFGKSLGQFEVQVSGGSGAIAFSFMEGNIVKAARNGDWVLLDEVNLASPDTLESIADLLTGPAEKPSILLSETGEIERVRAHPNFRIFGAMNPATDVGKRDLPIGIRSRFTEIYVDSPDKDVKDLLTIVKTYLKSSSTKDEKAADDIARLYLDTKQRAEEKRLVDGANEVPHFSLRTLTRALSYVNHIAPFYGLRRALYEGFSMGFLTLLDRESEKILLPLIDHRLFGQIPNPQSLLAQLPKQPGDGKQYVRFVNKAKDRHYWLHQGDFEPMERSDYIITPYVERNLLNLVRATSTRRFPILIQGPTSAGKTSMIEYLANYTGNKFVRINNHEHTDLQEYLGTYVSDSSGKLKFQEGLLVQALRQGHWIVLDELNLAPTDVLEALNRLLDDNRELLIPETQEVVRPHENFMLFATQNPPGLYGGRKALSRAFRNRFLELHYDDIPEDELEFILQQRSRNVAPSDCKRIVTVYKDLSRLRQTGRMFEQKDSFATLRDLFRWTERSADTREQIAINGFMLLAERVRVDEERMAVKEVIEKVFKVKIDPDELYQSALFRGKARNSQGVVWTGDMRRLYTLVDCALRNNEPVLLVGDTGCGKTTVCQLLAEALKKELHIVNAHQNTETGDLIGSQRPVRNRGAISDSLKTELVGVLDHLCQPSSGTVEELLTRYHSLSQEMTASLDSAVQEKITFLETRSKALFEWSDGSLVHAMKTGDLFLLDEISLADDSVLERLNSVLEPKRSLLLAEKGVDNSFVVASEGFQFLATMNPGGDFGKKELSPALRNRFTEIWVSSLSNSEDVLNIVRSKLDKKLKPFANIIVDFSAWFGKTFRASSAAAYSIRDILLWVKFVNHFGPKDANFGVVHGAATVFIDTLGANPSALLAMDPKTMEAQRQECLDQLSTILKCDASKIYRSQAEVVLDSTKLSIGGFEIPREQELAADPTFAFNAPTTRLNAMRVLRSLQMQKPILLEGSPGVGKTTLVAALAKTCGRPLTRINLSDQTDLMDLFGTDMPVEGAEAGNFAWRDAPFLQAMQKGEWVLLDEMNLASQSVLEGLNACLDHRGEVYISELDQVFQKHPDFRLFAAQNPHHQGGGRKGLPSSFVNRFIVVYADIFTEEDLVLIASHNFPNVSQDIVQGVIRFITTLDHKVVVEKTFGQQGGPWEFNLRDILRWFHLLNSSDPLLASSALDDFLGLVVRQRFRAASDQKAVDDLFTQIFSRPPREHSLFHDMNSISCQVGNVMLSRNQVRQPQWMPHINTVSRLSEIESVMICIKQNIPCILSGPSGSGKSALLQHVAAIAGKALVVFPLNADIDTMDLVGGFEQADPLREVNAALRELRETLEFSVLSQVPGQVPQDALSLLHRLEAYRGNVEDLEAIDVEARSVLAQVAETSPIARLLSTVVTALGKPLTANDPRFEWLDGVIIKALQRGDWLVLDNANLCNASVLDRLNSLLEPNGFLSINEHCGPDGEPRLIKPSPDFRIFLTVDPRYGELSRAMRNRAAEIHLDELPIDMTQNVNSVDTESSLHRYQISNDISGASSAEHFAEVSALSLQGLSLQDTASLHRVDGVLSQGMTGLSAEAAVTFSQNLTAVVGYLSADDAAYIRRATSELYAALPANEFANLRDAQPLSPLHNAPVARLLHRVVGDAPFWVDACLGFFVELQRCQAALVAHSRGARPGNLAALNRFQRSAISSSGRIAAVAKDSTIGVSKFLHEVLRIISAYLQANVKNADNWRTHAMLVKQMLDFWWRTLGLVTTKSFEEARFQAHLRHGDAALEKCQPLLQEESDRELWSKFSQTVQDNFTAGFTLKTGLSMEVLWKQLKPSAILSEEALKQSKAIEKLAVRFDELRWKVRTSVSGLTSAMSTLVAADDIVRKNTSTAPQLLEDLNKEIATLEASIGTVSRDVKPFFQAEFETLRQALAVDAIYTGSVMPSEQTTLAVLSGHPTVDQIRLSAVSGKAQRLFSAGRLAFHNQDAQVWSGKLASAVLNRTNSIKSASLDSLRMLEAELPILGRTLANRSAEMASNSLMKLNAILKQLILEIGSVAGPELVEKLQAVYVDIFGKKHLRLETIEILNAEIIRCLGFLGDGGSSYTIKYHLAGAMLGCALLDAHLSRVDPGDGSVYQDIHALTSLCWVNFSVACIHLYVPDKAFDPQLRSQFNLEVYDATKAKLDLHLGSVIEFERLFTGQETSLRAELAQDELKALGAPPPTEQLLYRPQRSELGRIQADFSNILKTVIDMDVVYSLVSFTWSRAEGTKSELDLCKQNIGQLIDRLGFQFDAYQDMIQPALDILHGLHLGISLTDSCDALKEHIPTGPFLDALPFLGGQPPSSQMAKLPTRSLNFLRFLSLTASIEGLSNLSAPNRQGLFESVHGFFDDWNKKLEADRKAEEARTSLYKFRGSFEDEEEQDEEEFNELFPTYDDEEKPAVQRERVRELSVRLAQLHRQIFLAPEEPTTSLRRACASIAQDAAAEACGLAAVDQSLNARMLPMTLWQVNEELSALSSTTAVDGKYNFYVDPNLPAVRQLISLVNKVEVRFRELQQVDEIGFMQPLTDVLAACETLLAIVHTEPLASILPKLERLHGIVYEWQHGGYAPAIYGAPVLYASLTETIINWRREELKTWAKLFDHEADKCREDADSWFFMAYQVVVAVPLSMVDSASELQQYAVNLVKELEVYFSTSIAGQFSARLALLGQLHKHLELLVVDYPLLRSVSDAVQNFISFYSNFEAAISSSIAQARAPIEKNVKNTVLMASWKDTNINALRESALKSHRSLFRLVRKFRAVLGQPVTKIIEQGLPETSKIASSQVSQEPSDLKADTLALARCQEVAPAWVQQHKRLSNVSKTLSIMKNVVRLNSDAVDPQQELVSFVESTAEAIALLRKETPSILTDENKNQVKHLKTRKRNLFADVLKALRQMGIRHNLGTEDLEMQNTTSKVLGTAPPHVSVDSDNAAAEHFFFKAVDTASRVRGAGHEHHSELTPAEILRSIGFMEGMVQILKSQRSTLASACKSDLALQEALASTREISTCWGDKSLSIAKTTSNLSQIVQWAVPTLRFGIQLVEVHGKLGVTDNSGVVKILQNRLEVLSASSRKRSQHATTHGKLKILEHEEDDAVARFALECLKNELIQLTSERPDLAFILQQIRPWTYVSDGSLSDAAAEACSIEQFGAQIATICDSALVAVQNYKKASAGLPSSVESPAWLSKSSAVYRDMLQALHLDEVAAALKRSLSLLERVDLSSPVVRKATTSMLATVLPIYEQYAATCQKSIRDLRALHEATGRMAHFLGQTFSQLAAKGFCTPQEKSDETQGDSGKLEGGEGLGDGEGAEDISKDIQPDEDMTELAQEPNKEHSGEMDDEKDAVDMADEEMEGEMASVDGADDDEKEDGKDGDGEDEDDIEEEAGDVDDLDPTAVDEKMWDGDNEEEADKDQKGENAKGQQKDDQTASDDKPSDETTEQQEAAEDQQEPEANDDPAMEQEDVKYEEDIQQDQNVQQEDALALPDDMELDLKDADTDSSDDELEDDGDDGDDDMGKAEDRPEEKMSDAEDEGDDEQAKGRDEEENMEDVEEEADIGGNEVDDEPKDAEEDPNEEPQPEQPDEVARQDQMQDTANADAENAAPSDVKSGGQDQNADSMDADEEFSNNAAQREEGDAGDGSAKQQAEAGQKGSLSRSNEQGPSTTEDNDEEDASEEARQDPFKKLGDALERWHRQQSDIKDAQPQDDEAEMKQAPDSEEMAAREFQHLENDDAAPDAQAMGGAADEQVQPIDEAMAIDDEEKEDPASRVMPEQEAEAHDPNEGDKMDTDEAEDVQARENAADADEGRSGVKTQQGAYDRDDESDSDNDGGVDDVEQSDEEDVDETSAQLHDTHITGDEEEEQPLRDFDESMQLWTDFQTKTSGLSLSLTSQLRLILTPSQSTKLSGSFRTGKRLNIKKIIPYIASSYKRDKIWMRRAVPTKRSYQILLCVDDSRSMGETSSGRLALESLVMVSRALTMLEVGQVGVLGFGSSVFTAHELTAPFSSHDAGAKVLQRFRFEQDRTDVAMLVRETIEHFREAKLKNPARGGEDLWQLALILSDGLTPSSAHDTIRRQLREAMEERIMVVFIVMDDTKHRKGDSVLDLKEARFVKDQYGNSQVVIERYLDTFPFPYFLIVHNLEDLPNALAGLLRTWFAEVNS
ncbi:midasin [Plectosphaerella plurivora]|uniref:Midasin n=1 Tax=Plectosphaerella plurivora TaxID=936078 RepID=A0A9P9A6D1_9PEZI|nr:midasin [Plectosphaerella plurivora]